MTTCVALVQFELSPTLKAWLDLDPHVEEIWDLSELLETLADLSATNRRTASVWIIPGMEAELEK